MRISASQEILQESKELICSTINNTESFDNNFTCIWVVTAVICHHKHSQDQSTATLNVYHYLNKIGSIIIFLPLVDQSNTHKQHFYSSL